MPGRRCRTCCQAHRTGIRQALYAWPASLVHWSTGMAAKMREDDVHGADKVCGLRKAQQLSAPRQGLLLTGCSVA